ncbi:hypothetical protein HDIA_4737 [Hartmannibacter diazotrophicus]|uniref:YgjP-like metallopeptidase domain-containing protein n=1 Tax=Hartmannibacter diazotrophicus TaxID=1482074 RepID=A0A2C9DDV2_9HYPH|nr:SprT family zinc-dependent metalloprotease [Hartmannibacter diazotrophicus]SON58278.1 hypothetical protein HDIA_4737 [Hartmannibacter diazotrophicus]
MAGGSVRLSLNWNSRAKRYSLRIAHGRTEPVLTIPRGGTLERARAFASRHANWLAHHLDRAPQAVAFEPGAILPFRGEDHRLHPAGTLRGLVKIGPGDADEPLPRILVPGDPARFERRVRDFLVAAARTDIEAAVARHTAVLGRSASRVTLRDTTSRWGSCSSRGALSFSWRLILAPPFVLDYLAAHEVAHLAEMNHGPRFWAHCESLCPRTAEARVWLKSNGSRLHAYGKA